MITKELDPTIIRFYVLLFVSTFIIYFSKWNMSCCLFKLIFSFHGCSTQRNFPIPSWERMDTFYYTCSSWRGTNGWFYRTINVCLFCVFYSKQSLSLDTSEFKTKIMFLICYLHSHLFLCFMQNHFFTMCRLDKNTPDMNIFLSIPGASEEDQIHLAFGVVGTSSVCVTGYLYVCDIIS